MKNIIVSEKATNRVDSKAIAKGLKDVKRVKDVKVGNTGRLKGGLKYVIMKNAFLLF